MLDVDSAEKPASVIAFCAGYGGIERGLELAGVNHRVVAYVEIEAFAIANLVAKMEARALASAPIWSDLKTFPAHLFRDRVDLITGGYPCQPFSSAGYRKGRDDPRHLWPHIRRHIKAIRPFRCFFENVEGHISLGLRDVIADLEEDSYTATWGIFSAAEVGAPHRRKRVFILADSNGDNLRQQPRRGRRQDRQGAALVGIDGQAKPVADAIGGVKGSQPSMGKNQKKKIEQGTKFSGGGAHVADANSIASPKTLCARDRETPQPEPGGSFGASGRNWAVEPKLGRVADGIADRVDRLRLLGNGVVPQQAAKAWTVLSEQIWQE